MSKLWTLCRSVSKQKKGKKKEAKAAIVASSKIEEYSKKFEEFSLALVLSNSRVDECVDIDAWLVNSRTSHHMTRIRAMFQSISDIDAGMHVDSGVNTTHAMEGVGCVKFQLKSRG